MSGKGFIVCLRRALLCALEGLTSFLPFMIGLAATADEGLGGSFLRRTVLEKGDVSLRTNIF